MPRAALDPVAQGDGGRVDHGESWSARRQTHVDQPGQVGSRGRSVEAVEGEAPGSGGATSGHSAGLPLHKHLSRKQALRVAPGLRKDALVGAVQYYDAQVDDARHTMTLVRTAAAYGALVANRARVVGFLREGERVTGVRVRDLETAPSSRSRAQQVVNATGVWTDETQAMVGERGQFQVRASKGIHLVVPRDRILSHDRPHPAHRDVGAVRHPVGPALDRRHHRHRLDARQGAPGRVQPRHRLPARPGQHGAGHAADPRGRRGRVRRPAPAARRRERADLASFAASTSSRTPRRASSSSPAASTRRTG